MEKRLPDDSVDSDCSADDVLSDDPSLVPMPGVTSGPKKPAAKKAARLLGIYGVHLSPPLPIGGNRGRSRIKGLTINYCKDRRLSQILERSLLSRLAEHLKVKIDSCTVSLLSVYHSVLSRLKALDLIEARGAQVRSRVEEGETSSSYFSI